MVLIHHAPGRGPGRSRRLMSANSSPRAERSYRRTPTGSVAELKVVDKDSGDPRESHWRVRDLWAA